MTPATKPILDDVETNDEVFVTDGPCDVADDPINPQEQANNHPPPLGRSLEKLCFPVFFLLF